jgi:hypothetical protein
MELLAVCCLPPFASESRPFSLQHHTKLGAGNAHGSLHSHPFKAHTPHITYLKFWCVHTGWAVIHSCVCHMQKRTYLEARTAITITPATEQTSNTALSLLLAGLSSL